jgi:hypothetical protein
MRMGGVGSPWLVEAVVQGAKDRIRDDYGRDMEQGWSFYFLIRNNFGLLWV